MDFICKTCGTRFPGVPTDDRRGPAADTRGPEQHYNPGLGCPNPSCKNHPSGVQMGWARRAQ